MQHIVTKGYILPLLKEKLISLENEVEEEELILERYDEETEEILNGDVVKEALRFIEVYVYNHFVGPVEQYKKELKEVEEYNEGESFKYYSSNFFKRLFMKPPEYKKLPEEGLRFGGLDHLQGTPYGPLEDEIMEKLYGLGVEYNLHLDHDYTGRFASGYYATSGWCSTYSPMMVSGRGHKVFLCRRPANTTPLDLLRSRVRELEGFIKQLQELGESQVILSKQEYDKYVQVI